MEQSKYANMIPSVISRSCNKLLIGNTYWKQAVLPTVIFGADVLGYTSVELEKKYKERYKKRTDIL